MDRVAKRLGIGRYMTFTTWAIPCFSFTPWFCVILCKLLFYLDPNTLPAHFNPEDAGHS